MGFEKMESSGNATSTEVDKDWVDPRIGEDSIKVESRLKDDISCPKKYYLILIDIDEQKGEVTGWCNPCAPACSSCSGPEEDDCTACPQNEKLYINMEGRTTCIQGGCP